ncbi:ComF family protein [Aedoeadaptatus coli]|uniref:ComF family protein n=1 Tax=Aedoeadaptatus coli TaxID=2058292 RepID=UPI000D552DC2|nr:ComF family protein [Peptoniphilus coli]
MVSGLFASGDCALCKKEAAAEFHLCESCLDTLSFIGEEIYSEKTFPVYALLRENRAASFMIEGLKFREERFWAQVFGEMAADFCRHTGLGPFDAVLCVPTSAKKRRIRGYNPPGLIAGELGLRMQLPFEEALYLTKKVKDQIGLGAKARALNVRGAFAAKNVFGKHLLLFDDTYTTGATLKAAEIACMDAGAASVTGIVCMKARDVDYE